MSLFGELFEADENLSNQVWGVTTGIVQDNWDEENKGKVKVLLNLGNSEKNLTGWIPVMTPYGGKGFGMYTLPEIGSLVVIAFLMGDRNQPIVIGSLWSDKNMLPKETAVDQNTTKRFCTKGGIDVLFSEEKDKHKISMITPKKLKVILEDETQKIYVTDEKKENGVIVDAKNGTLSLQAKKKMELKIDGKTVVTLGGTGKNIELKGDKIEIQASQTAHIKGQQANVDGSMVTVKADSKLSLQSSGMSELKGAMVKIN